jgi:ferric-dicitrate binding protein FerR (iron transport regulator)
MTRIDDATLDLLLRLAPPEAGMPPERERRVKEAVQAAFRARVVQTRRRRVSVLWSSGLATAAVLAVLLVVARGPEPPAATGGSVARVERVVGALRGGAAVRAGDSVTAGATLETGGQDRASVRLAGGGSLRLDWATRLRIESATDLVIEHGTIYLDSDGAAQGGAAVAVRTPDGVVREIGTRFEVRVEPDLVRVRVREGRIGLARAGVEHEAAAGDELHVSGDEVARARVPTYGAHWDWVQRITPGFVLEGASLRDLLAWVSRETGRAVRFESEALEREAAPVLLHGSVEGLTPEDALGAVLPTCGLAHRLRDGAIVVERAPGAAGRGR